MGLDLNLRGMDTYSGEMILSNLFYLPSEKQSILKGKNLSQQGDPFWQFCHILESE